MTEQRTVTKKVNSRWRKGAVRVTSDIVQGAWNRNLQEREQAPSEIRYVESFRYPPGWRGGARGRTVRV